MRYYYADQNRQPVGPVTEEELQAKVAEGVITPDTFVIAEGATEWKAYSVVFPSPASVAVPPPPTPASKPEWATSAPPPVAEGHFDPTDSKARFEGRPAVDQPNANPIGLMEGLLWFICCAPVGMMRFGQPVKGWIWLVGSIFTGGIAWLVWLVDYWMCWSISQKRKLGEWEFFPTK